MINIKKSGVDIKLDKKPVMDPLELNDEEAVYSFEEVFNACNLPMPSIKYLLGEEEPAGDKEFLSIGYSDETYGSDMKEDDKDEDDRDIR